MNILKCLAEAGPSVQHHGFEHKLLIVANVLPMRSAGHLGDGSSDLLMLRLPTGGSVMPHVAPWYWVRRLIGTASQSPTLPVETIKRGAQTILATTSNMIDKFEKQDLN